MRNLWETYFDFNYGAAIATGVAVFCICVFILVQKKKNFRNVTAVAWGEILIFSVYMTFLLGVTLLNQKPEESYRLELQPLWSYMETLWEHDWALGKQIVYNILSFLPFGFFIPLIFRKMRKLIRTAACGLLFSAGIELIQLIFKCGLCELDDILNNTVGTMMGYGIFVTPLRIKRKEDYDKNPETITPADQERNGR